MKAMTKKSLEEAFAGESMAHMKYLAFSQIADKEGFEKVAKLFRAISYAESIHAIHHAKTMGILGNTAENLQGGIDGEHFEITEMYPAYEAIAKLQEEKKAIHSIKWAMEAEKTHEELYKLALAAVKNGKDFDIDDVYICNVCGYAEVGKPTKNCPICGVGPDKFDKF